MLRDFYNLERELFFNACKIENLESLKSLSRYEKSPFLF